MAESLLVGVERAIGVSLKLTRTAYAKSERATMALVTSAMEHQPIPSQIFSLCAARCAGVILACDGCCSGI